MGAIENYKIEIVQRTKEILENYYPDFQSKDREVTFLMNCLLGLIVAISENEKRDRKILKGSLDSGFLILIPDKVGFIESRNVTEDITDKDLTQLNVNVSHKKELASKEKFWFVNKLRNGIAHQNIQGVNENGSWVGVRVWNMEGYKKDFEIVFNVNELKTFAIKLAEMYLE